jgi:hypothetical protein
MKTQLYLVRCFWNVCILNRKRRPRYIQYANSLLLVLLVVYFCEQKKLVLERVDRRFSFLACFLGSLDLFIKVKKYFTCFIHNLDFLKVPWFRIEVFRQLPFEDFFENLEYQIVLGMRSNQFKQSRS